MNKKLLYSIVAVIIVTGIIGTTIINLQDSDTNSVQNTDNFEIPKIVNIGVMLPATGDLASHGQDNNIATQLALDDFNDHLDSINASWRMNIIVEDTQTDPVVALEKIQSLNAKGVKLVVGTETSAELNNVKSYADSNNMLLVSPSSTSPKLAINDNIFRLIPDDTKQGKVLAELFVLDEIKVIIPIYRGDVWGDGLYDSTRSSFESLGGVVDDGIRYSPEVTVFSSEASLLDSTLKKYLAEGYSYENIAVLMIGFSEVVHIFNFVNSYDELHKVRWYGSDASSNDDSIVNDSISSKFAQDVNFVATQFAASSNPTVQRINDHLILQTGSLPNTYAYSSYDALWLLGLSILETDSMDAKVIKSVLSRVASTYDGAVGKIVFNEYGDLALSDYALWSVHNGDWYLHGHYSVKDNSFEFFDTILPEQ